MESTTKHLILMVGIPAAGKSTIAREIFANLENVEVIEFDQIEKEINPSGVFNPELWC
jgi:predicted kinase